jgi:UDP-N-acetylmuramoyl-tripeptide--D-alanyl-D-alanine ligase
MEIIKGANIFILTLFVFLFSGLPVFRLFQIKDWLLSRVLADYFHLRGRKYILNKKDLLVILILFAYIIFPKIFFQIFYIFGLVFLNFAEFFSLFELNPFNLFIFLLLFPLIFLRKNLLKTIKITPKALMLFSIFFFLNFLFIYLAYIFHDFNYFFVLYLFLLISYTQIFLFSLALSIFDLMVSPYLFYLRERVKNKLKNLNIKKIVIVGSYGKSTTKEFLNHLLKDKKTFSLPPRINHEYAIFKYLLKNSLQDFEYLILELGSYFLGNVRWVCKGIIPDFVFITGITKQHYFLFGENIKNIIYGEGIEAVLEMKKGKVFVNTSHEYFEILKKEIEKISKNKEIEIVTYGKEGDYSYEILFSSEEKTIFKLNAKGEEHILETNLIYPPQIENLVGALSFVLEEKILSLEEINEKIKNLKMPKTFLKPIKYKNVTIFDDSYNANLKGVLEGIRFLEKADFEKKIVIFNGILELGRETRKIYENLAKEFSKFDFTLFTDKEEYKFFKKILKEKAVLIKNQKDLDEFLNNLKEKSGIFIFNRFPSHIKLNLENEENSLY